MSIGSTDLPPSLPPAPAGVKLPDDQAQVTQAAAIMASRKELPRREEFFAALHAAIAENNRQPVKKQSLGLAYYEALLRTPAYMAQYGKKGGKALTSKEAKEQGEALVEQYILAHMPGFSGESMTPPNEKLQEQELVAGELLARKFTRNVTGFPIKAYQEIPDADGDKPKHTAEARHFNRRGFVTRAALGGTAFVLGTWAISDVLKKEFGSWMYDKARLEQHRRTEELQKKLASGKAITKEDIHSVDMKTVVQDEVQRADPNTDQRFMFAIAKVCVAGSAALVGGAKLIWHLSAYRGNPSDRAMHEHAKVLLGASRELEPKVRALYDQLPAGPSLLPPQESPQPG